MEDEESIIITIAEAEGWTECRSVIKGAGGGTRTPTAHGKPPNRNYEAPCPRYTIDLNAMHRAEQKLTDVQKDLYINQFGGKDGPSQQDLIFATALQRAKAFIKVIK